MDKFTGRILTEVLEFEKSNVRKIRLLGNQLDFANSKIKTFHSL